MTIPEAARELILEGEGFRSKPERPGGESGVTIGFGYDLGYVTVDQFDSDWSDRIRADVCKRLRAVVGLRAQRARNRVGELSDVRVSRNAAEQVFDTRTLPLYELRTAQAFSGAQALPEDARGAPVSLVWDRGTSMVDNFSADRRCEMCAIRDAVAEGDLAEIAEQLRAMRTAKSGRRGR